MRIFEVSKQNKMQVFNTNLQIKRELIRINELANMGLLASHEVRDLFYELSISCYSSSNYYNPFNIIKQGENLIGKIFDINK